MDYKGEHTFIGELGTIFVVVAFAASLLSGIAFFINSLNKQESFEKSEWEKLGITAFYIHGAAVIGILSTLFFMLFNQYFEYHYVWKHSNTSMPTRYIFSCFWEGQEGSFLLWIFWHVVIGGIILKTAGRWLSPVMSIFNLVQLTLVSMLLGIYVFGLKIGSDPFILVRELPENINLPWTEHADYLKRYAMFDDGKGLNPLLQNYWMTIHPPTLFLGFATTLPPFAYALTALWKKEHFAWLKHAIPWAFVCVTILGTGVLMGGAWAYEALSFGGFWAWDPVENASLVPWIMLM
ncbi:MAG: cytochrome c biogenesis protein CcsA [Flavobacteriales bacterium]